MRLTLHVTDRCNLNCRHCVRDPAGTPVDLALDVVRRVAEQAGAYGITHVGLTGGEPMLHPELPAILDEISRRGLNWSMVSNGGRVARLAEVFAASPHVRERATSISLSLDGASEAVHDEIRGAGSYREVMEAVGFCVAIAMPFILKLTVNARNVHELESFALQAAQLGAAKVSLAPLMATGSAHDADLALPRRAWDKVQDRIVRLGEILSIPVDATEGYPTQTRFHVCGPWQSQALHVNVHGKLSLCCTLSGTPDDGRLSDECGDLATTSLADAHASALDLIHELQRRRVREIREGTLGPWDEMNCNWCQKQFGKPHWTDEGVGGAAASRERWRGAWADGSTGRPLVARDASSRVRLNVIVPDAE